MILEDIVQNFEAINKHFGLELWESSKCFRGKCPIHNGDNKSSLTIYKDGHTSPGNWKCFTGNCQEEYGGSVLGFISAILSVRRNKNVSKHEAVTWCEEFFGKKFEQLEIDDDMRLTNFINKSTDLPISYSFRLKPEDFISKLKTPTYFIKRGYKEETLFDFKVGHCTNPTKPFYERILVPQFDEEGFVVACLGRSVHEKCELCNNFHAPTGICRTFPKWKNSDNFPSYNLLYNFHNAKKSIEDSGIVMIVESSPNVWRLKEAGFDMAIGTFGSKFSDAQKSLLDTAQVQTIIVVPDQGQAGQFLVNHVRERCEFTHNIVTINPSYNDDIGRCNVETVKTILGPYVDKHLGKN